MKKFNLLMKTLLMAVCLFVGTSAWADGNKRTLSAQDYETAESTDWVTNNDKITISLVSGDATYGKYAKVEINGAANRGAYKTITPSFGFGTGYTTAGMTVSGYNVEFDMLIQSGNTQDRSVSQFVVTTESYTTTSGTLYSGDYVFALSQPTRSESGFDTKWYVNDLTYSDEDKAATLSNTVWYHVKLVVTASSVDYTIINKSTSETVKSGSKTVAALPSLNEFFTVVGRGYGKTQFDNLEIYDYVDAETVTAPTIAIAYAGANRTVTITPGVSSESNAVTTYYTLDGTDPTSSSSVYSTPLDIDADCMVKAISISTASVSSTVASQSVTVGKIDLATPTITASGFSNTTGVYVTNPTFNFTCNNKAVDGNPTATLSYTFTPEGGSESAVTEATSFTPTTKGTLKVIASHSDYNSSEKTLVVSNAYSISFSGRDYTTATISDISTTEGVWGDEFDVTWTGWASGLKANLRKTDMSDDNRLRIRNTNTINYVNGWGWVRSGSSYNYGSRYANEGYFVGLKINTSKGNDADALTYLTTYCSSGTGKATDVVEIGVPADYLVQRLYFYEAATVSDVDIAIADCKSHETSSAFATAIDAESFASVDEVYAFHTQWQINQADAASSNDITKVIFDAAVSSNTRWNGARTLSGQQYTGAPDNTYFDAYNTEVSNASQTIYGLPAGTYTIKVATRSSANVTDKSKYNVWVSGGSADASLLGSHIGNAGGNLGNGWNWTYLSFTLAAEADVTIGFYARPEDNLWAGCDDWHLYKGTLETSVSATVGESGYATFVSPYSLDFTGTSIKPYTVTVAEKGVATLTEKTQVPSNTPVLLYYAGGSKTEDIPVIGSANPIGDNDLIAGAGNTVATIDGTYTNMILNVVDEKIGFYYANDNEVATNRAYLHILTTLAPDRVDGGSAPMLLVFANDDITGISATLVNSEKVNSDVYDLQGRKVMNPTKGLYIVNGKKVIIK